MIKETAILWSIIRAAILGWFLWATVKMLERQIAIKLVHLCVAWKCWLTLTCAGKTNHSVTSSSVNWIQRPGNLCFAINQFGGTGLYNPVFQQRWIVSQGCYKWCQVNTFLKEPYVRWMLLCTIYTSSTASVLWLVGMRLSENSLSFASGNGLSAQNMQRYKGSPGHGMCFPKLLMQQHSAPERKTFHPLCIAAQLSPSGLTGPIWGWF